MVRVYVFVVNQLIFQFCYFLFVFCSICVTCVASGPYWVIHEATTDCRLWLCVLLVTFLAVLPRIVFGAALSAFNPSVITSMAFPFHHTILVDSKALQALLVRFSIVQ